MTSLQVRCTSNEVRKRIGNRRRHVGCRRGLRNTRLRCRHRIGQRDRLIAVKTGSPSRLKTRRSRKRHLTSKQRGQLRISPRQARHSINVDRNRRLRVQGIQVAHRCRRTRYRDRVGIECRLRQSSIQVSRAARGQRCRNRASRQNRNRVRFSSRRRAGDRDALGPKTRDLSRTKRVESLKLSSRARHTRHKRCVNSNRSLASKRNQISRIHRNRRDRQAQSIRCRCRSKIRIKLRSSISRYSRRHNTRRQTNKRVRISSTDRTTRDGDTRIAKTNNPASNAIGSREVRNICSRARQCSHGRGIHIDRRLACQCVQRINVHRTVRNRNRIGIAAASQTRKGRHVAGTDCGGNNTNLRQRIQRVRFRNRNAVRNRQCNRICCRTRRDTRRIQNGQNIRIRSAQRGHQRSGNRTRRLRIQGTKSGCLN